MKHVWKTLTQSTAGYLTVDYVKIKSIGNLNIFNNYFSNY